MTHPRTRQAPQQAPGPLEPLRQLVERSADGVLVVALDGRVRFANAAAAQLLGKPHGELPGYHFGYPAVGEQAVEMVLAPRAAEPTTVELRAVEIEWEGEQALLVNLRDITSRKQQERRITLLNSALRTVLEVEELILRERDPRALLRGACDILVAHRNYKVASIVLQDDDGSVQLVTEAVGDDGDLSLQPAVRLARFPPCCNRALREPLETVRWRPPTDDCNHCTMAGKYDGQARLVAAIQSEGRVFGVLTLVAPPHMERDGEELDLIHRLAADLGYAIRSLETEVARRETEAKLGETEERFRLVFENSADAIMIADEAGRYIHVNRAACEMFGYDREALLSMNVADLLVPEDHESAGAQFDEHARAGDQAGTFTFVRPDGTQRIAEYSPFALSPNRFASILRDVTESRTMEERMRQSQKMEAVGQLAGGVAHDFNNLLTAIISFAGFVRDDLPHGDPRRDDITEVLRAADRASSLTRQLLTFSRRQPIAPARADLNELVVDAERLLRRTLGEDIEIRTRLAPNVWPVFVDCGQFEQVVMNLAVNARDAMPAGGRLLIETANQPASARTADQVLLRFADDGEGMGEEVMARIFEPFFTTKEAGKGTGLGLAMVYGLVTQAGGSISVDSEPGRGTSFEILLPRASGTVMREKAGQRSISSLIGSETLLVVEDELMVRRSVVRILSMYGYSVLQAASGEEALAILRDHAGEVDLVLCDVVMPGMNGRETVDALRHERPDLQALFMTGYTENAIVHRGVLEPGVELLSKPFSREALLLRLREILDAPEIQP